MLKMLLAPNSCACVMCTCPWTPPCWGNAIPQLVSQSSVLPAALSYFSVWRTSAACLTQHVWYAPINFKLFIWGSISSRLILAAVYHVSRRVQCWCQSRIRFSCSYHGEVVSGESYSGLFRVYNFTFSRPLFVLLWFQPDYITLIDAGLQSLSRTSNLPCEPISYG